MNIICQWNNIKYYIWKLCKVNSNYMLVVFFFFKFKQMFRNALVKMFEVKDLDCVFLETNMSMKKRYHMVYECIPLPKEVGDMAPIYFKVHKNVFFSKSFECICHNSSISGKLFLILKCYFWKDGFFDPTSWSILWSCSLILKQVLWGSSVFQVVIGRAVCHSAVASSLTALTKTGRRWEKMSSFLKCCKDCNTSHLSPVV